MEGKIERKKDCQGKEQNKSMKMDCGMAAMFIELSSLGKENDFDKQKGNYSVPKCSASHDE